MEMMVMRSDETLMGSWVWEGAMGPLLQARAGLATAPSEREIQDVVVRRFSKDGRRKKDTIL